MSSPQGVQRAWVDEIVLYLGDRFEVPVRKPIKIGRFIMPPTEVIGDHLDHILDDLVDETGAQELLDRPTPYMMWSATEFLGRDPTSSESAAISRALRRLGQRGLIRRRR